MTYIIWTFIYGTNPDEISTDFFNMIESLDDTLKKGLVENVVHVDVIESLPRMSPIPSPFESWKERG